MSPECSVDSRPGAEQDSTERKPRSQSLGVVSVLDRGVDFPLVRVAWRPVVVVRFSDTVR